jgi:hypothetical protein
MGDSYLYAHEELQKTLLRLMHEDVDCAEALSALADLTTQIALANYRCEDVPADADQSHGEEYSGLALTASARWRSEPD